MNVPKIENPLIATFTMFVIRKKIVTLWLTGTENFKGSLYNSKIAFFV